MGISAGVKPEIPDFWVSWNPGAFNIQIYRLRVGFYHPDSFPQEGAFTVTLDPPQKVGFVQPIELPPVMQKLIRGGNDVKKAIITFDFRTTDDFSMAKTYRLSRLRAILQKQKPRPPEGLNRLHHAVSDPPMVLSLDFHELNTRKKKLKELEAAAKAKAAKAAPAKPIPPSPQPVSAPPSIPSVKDVIAKEKAQSKEEMGTAKAKEN